MTTALDADTRRIVTALATYRADLRTCPRPWTFPPEIVRLSEGAAYFQADGPESVHAAAYGFRCPSRQDMDRLTVVGPDVTEAETVDIARTLAQRAHAVARRTVREYTHPQPRP